ncbi:hypothetical protein ETAA1_17610 [Urbifossiella limnaea]|uniref:Uncharacterized protein n=1 Tax=Urbifossiella limnaea TaxID=2528023 RepID=A0A517XQP6_9BACT|nr:hypothetical protein ETAA1_17610 [Urbifossiella limnaea]
MSHGRNPSRADSRRFRVVSQFPNPAYSNDVSASGGSGYGVSGCGPPKLFTTTAEIRGSRAAVTAATSPPPAGSDTASTRFGSTPGCFSSTSTARIWSHTIQPIRLSPVR